MLVIDDDPIALEHAEIVLRQVGIQCDRALSGLEGIEKVKIAHGRREAFRRRNAVPVTAEADLNGRRVLLAEDVPVNAEILMIILSNRGIEAEHAVNGRIAAEMFEHHPAGYYDAILMDMRMPEMDGLEATKRIRSMEKEDAKTIPIITLTANAFDEDVQRSMQAGLNAHLTKPVEPDAPFESLAGLIGRDPVLEPITADKGEDNESEGTNAGRAAV